MGRVALRLAVGVVAALAVAAPAAAVGVNEVDLQVVLPTDGSGRAVLELGVEPVAVELRLRNVADAPRTVRLYAVEATRDDEGSYQLGTEGDTRWLTLGLGAEEIVLDAKERRTLEVIADPRRLPREPSSHAAIVIESGSGSTVVTRAVSAFRVSPSGVLGMPIAPFVLAALLLLAMLLAHLARRRLERRTAQPAVVAAAA